MRIGVVIPTLSGRENLLDQTLTAYQEVTPEEYDLRIVVPRNADGIARAWTMGAEALQDKDCDYLHLGADDALPAPTWAEAAVKAVENGIYPSPRIILPDGSLESCGTLGGGMWLPEVEDGAPAQASGFPFLPFGMWKEIIPLPPVHHYADDFIAYQVRRQGFDVRVCRGYCFTHLDGQVGRARHVARGFQNRAIVLAEIGRRAPVEMAA